MGLKSAQSIMLCLLITLISSSLATEPRPKPKTEVGILSEDLWPYDWKHPEVPECKCQGTCKRCHKQQEKLMIMDFENKIKSNGRCGFFELNRHPYTKKVSQLVTKPGAKLESDHFLSLSFYQIFNPDASNNVLGCIFEDNSAKLCYRSSCSRVGEKCGKAGGKLGNEPSINDLLSRAPQKPSIILEYESYLRQKQKQYDNNLYIKPSGDTKAAQPSPPRVFTAEEEKEILESMRNWNSEYKKWEQDQRRAYEINSALEADFSINCGRRNSFDHFDSQIIHLYNESPKKKVADKEQMAIWKADWLATFKSSELEAEKTRLKEKIGKLPEWLRWKLLERMLKRASQF